MRYLFCIIKNMHIIMDTKTNRCYSYLNKKFIEILNDTFTNLNYKNLHL